MVTCWIPLVDATRDNGCLYVIPGVHRGIFSTLHGRPRELPRNRTRGSSEPRTGVLRNAGLRLFLMTNLTPHASFANKTNIVRWSVDLRYHSFDVPHNVDEAPESYTPERDPVTMACHPAEADFIIRCPQDTSREVTHVSEFQEIRSRHEKNRPRSPGRGWTPLREREIRS